MSWNTLTTVALAGSLAVPMAAVVPLTQGQSAEPVVAATTPAQRVKATGKGTLVVRLTADDEVAAPAVVVRGPRGFSRRVAETTRLAKLPAGSYRILPRAAYRSGGTTTAAVSTDVVNVRAGRTASVHVIFRWKPAHNGGGTEPTAWETEVIRLTNVARSKNQDCGREGTFPPVPGVRMDKKLTLASRRHAADMAAHDYFDHNGRDGRDPGDRISAVGYRWSWWGENIAAGQESPAEVVDAWLDSDGHCANLMTKEFKELGVGFAKGGEYGTYWVQDFASPR